MPERRSRSPKPEKKPPKRKGPAIIPEPKMQTAYRLWEAKGFTMEGLGEAFADLGIGRRDAFGAYVKYFKGRGVQAPIKSAEVAMKQYYDPIVKKRKK